MRWQSADGSIQKRIYDQIMQFSSSETKQKYVDQLNSLYRSVDDYKRTLTSAEDDVLQTRASEAFKARMDELFPGVDTNKIGESVIESLGDVRKARNQIQSNAWQDVDSAYSAAGASVDLTEAAAAARQRIVPAEWSDEVLQNFSLDDIGSYLNVADPNKKLQRINYVLSQIDPVQDFAVAKELRSQLGSFYQKYSPTQLEKSGVDLGQVKQVYGELTNAMTSPRGVPDDVAQALGQKVTEANAKSVDYFNLFKLEGVPKIDIAKFGKAPGMAWEQVRRRRRAGAERPLEGKGRKHKGRRTQGA
jgi:hypothetical protein